MKMNQTKYWLFLFLFAFAFSLSFVFAQESIAGPSGCCSYVPCGGLTLHGHSVAGGCSCLPVEGNTCLHFCPAC